MPLERREDVSTILLVQHEADIKFFFLKFPFFSAVKTVCAFFGGCGDINSAYRFYQIC